MLGPQQEAQAALFYEFSLEDHVPQAIGGSKFGPRHLWSGTTTFSQRSGTRTQIQRSTNVTVQSALREN